MLKDRLAGQGPPWGGRPIMKTRGYYLPVFQDDSISFDKGRNRWRERLRGAQEVGETKRKSVDTERGERTENTEKTGEIKVTDKLSTEVVCGTEKGDAICGHRAR
ncbi:hypothetical protein GCM10007860_15680 [Chitiniphilus shinanonensis]|uniref:Uncharacterized protein n=1 Tax=Chitiniphilus shinanonensis TaxID=553088 RepID=A0ABQ6BV83_9NEIS|nr:hypothetical protein GCM10007860_15680 [Chitiniphilus shinanonensis]